MRSMSMTKTIKNIDTIEQAITWATQALTEGGVYCGHGTDNELDEAAWLVLHAMGLSPVEPIECADQILTSEQKQAVQNIIEQRISTRKPAAYLTHKVWFYGLPFFVDERVLVPRSPIAEMIQHGFAPWLLKEPKRILDLCTGSGCIGIACAYAFPDAQVVASDISTDALDVARINVDQHNLKDRVTLVQSDLLEGLKGLKGQDGVGGEFDLIVSNPPYVDAQDMAVLEDEYKQEPVLGLASGDDGLNATRVILAQAKQYLSDDGVLVVEVGNSEEALIQAYPQLPFIWQEFEFGGHGVFVLNKADLPD